MIASNLTNRLKHPSLVREQAVLAGEWLDTPTRITVGNPANDEVLAEVAVSRRANPACLNPACLKSNGAV